jgi:hypothetical protein
MRLSVAIKFGLCLLLSPAFIFGADLKITCPERILEPQLSDSLQEFFDFLTLHPLNDSVHEITAQAVDARSASAAPADLATYLESMQQWRTRVEGALYTEKEARPHIWFYPASGYDLATAVWMTDRESLRTRTSVFILVDQQLPFIAANEFGALPSAVEYSAEDLSENTDAYWAYSVTNAGLARTRSLKLGGLLPSTLSRMRAYYGDDFKVEKVFAIRDKAFLPPDRIYPTGSNLSFLSNSEHPTHGVVAFRIGNSPIHYAVFIHGRVSNNSPELVIGSWAPSSIPLSLKLFGMLDGVVVKGSQGVLSPARQKSPARDVLISALAGNGGILYEGNHQNPLSKYHEPSHDPEVTIEFGFIRGSSQPVDETFSTSLGTYSTARVEDWKYKWSYYDGARATRFRPLY